MYIKRSFSKSVVRVRTMVWCQQSSQIQMMYLSSHWKQNLAFSTLRTFFPPSTQMCCSLLLVTASILCIEQRLLACFPTHGRVSNSSHTTFPTTWTKATTLPHNMRPQQPTLQPPLNTTLSSSRHIMVISASRVCHLSHSSSEEWMHLIISAQMQCRIGHAYSFGPQSESHLLHTCVFVVWHISPAKAQNLSYTTNQRPTHD